MNETEQLIQRFWLGKTSNEENTALLQLLDNPEAEISDSLRAAFFKMKEEGKIVLHPVQSDRLLGNIHTRIRHSKQLAAEAPPAVIGLRGRRIWQVAASIIILLGAGMAMRLMIRHEAPAMQVAKHKQFLKTVANSDDTVMTAPLPDGSVVALEPHSAVSYYAPFGDSSRDISLSGKALFTVAKNAAKPFTVYANGIATTALGTVFTVNAIAAGTITVMLYEGKVVIRDADSSKAHLMERVYLSPGQSFTINKLTDQYLVQNITNEKPAPVAAPKRHPAAGAAILTFNNAPLADVFRQLNKQYRVTIQFDTADIAGLYFTGAVLYSDSLRTVLSAICNSNQLTFSELQGRIRVRRSN